MRNAFAVWSLLLGLLAIAAIPAAVVYLDRTLRFELIWAGVAVPAALLLGTAAVLLARAARRRSERTLRRTGRRLAAVGRLLGILGLLLAGTGAIALAVYAVLTYRGGS